VVDGLDAESARTRAQKQVTHNFRSHPSASEVFVDVAGDVAYTDGGEARIAEPGRLGMTDDESRKTKMPALAGAGVARVRQRSFDVCMELGTLSRHTAENKISGPYLS
jgi:hypothetical protein